MEIDTENSNYWENRYKNGGNSGAGSRGLLRLWKWKQINRYIDIKDSYVIDIGCGDLAFWKHHGCRDYIGMDLSQTRIDENRQMYPKLDFVAWNAAIPYKFKPAETVLCLDMLFHVMDDADYVRILHNLATYSKDYIFIYTWEHSPGQLTDTYQKYREFEDYLYVFSGAGFKLLEKRIPSKMIDKLGAMWIFKKIEK